jgi:hypothetical protein
MEQTFSDVLRECVQEEGSVGMRAAGMFIETFIGIIKENIIRMTTPLSKIIRALVISSLLLVVPFVASLFVDGMNWSRFDYVFAWLMFSFISLAFTFVLSSTANMSYKLAVGAAVVGAFTLVWIDGAVGIIGESESNVMYLGVIALLILGAAISRLRATGMSITLFAAALAQALVPVIALVLGEKDFAPGVLTVFILNAGWVVLFAFAGLLFRSAAQEKK